MKMNLTFEQYMSGLEESSNRWPNILKVWDDVDEDLKYEYRDQLEWSIENIRQARQMAIDEGLPKKDIDNRFLNVIMSFISIRKKLIQKTGLDVVELLNRK